MPDIRHLIYVAALLDWLCLGHWLCPGQLHAADWVLLSDRSHDVALGSAIQDGVIDIRTTGPDPYLVGTLSRQLQADERMLDLEYFCPSGINDFSAYIGPPFSERRHGKLPDLPIAEGWQRYTADLFTVFDKLTDSKEIRLDFGSRPDVRIQLRNVRIRARTEEEVQSHANARVLRMTKARQAQRITDYFKQSFPAAIHSIKVTGQSVHITGSDPLGGRSWQLVEYPPDQSIDLSGNVVTTRVDHHGGRFSISLPRLEGSRDRLHSGWRLRVEEGEFLTARHFATEIACDADNHAPQRAQPKSQKGLSGISRRGPLQDLPDLGVTAVTLNLVLNRFIAFTEGPERERIDVPGQQVFFNGGAFRHYDALVDFARKHDMVVSAIVLIPRPGDAVNSHPLVHPESDGGTYAMPEIATPRGAAVYAYVLNKVAQRYSNTSQAPGGITNWIAHNEADFHTVWTNMGQQPRKVFTETYYRSMRMIHNAARNYNPHARVFASLTHHWVVPDDSKWDRLAPRELLETLQRYSELEGDFAWGVAYHPYPQSLFAKVAWQDKDIRHDFETPLITMQNIDVLGRFLDQPSMRASDGSVRPVILSEQGYHTDSYDKADQANQAGSLWYAMKQLRQNPWIESFHYHRWIDHPGEGGLKLGLRTLPTNDHPHGERKRAWHVYQAFGTNRESAATDGLPSP